MAYAPPFLLRKFVQLMKKTNYLGVVSCSNWTEPALS